MQPPIQYARTDDGISIAYWTMGEGTPLVVMPSMPWSHLQLEWAIPELRGWYESLARNHVLIRYDGRGFGLSQRGVESMTMEDQVGDLAAVIDAVGLDHFDLYAGLHSGPVAVTFAVGSPERIDHLVLFASYADGAGFAEAPLTKATRPLIDQAWDFYAEAVARLLLGWSEDEAAKRFATLVRECVTPEEATMSLAATTRFDVRDLLPRVVTPTLILHPRELTIAAMDDARALAAGIPGARLSVLEGSSVAPYLGDADAVIREIEAFLGAGGIPAPAPGSLRTILFTDVVGSTDLTRVLGDAGARDVLRRHEQIVREELRGHGGTEIKTLGDGFMASFGSAVAAVECAIALQQRFASANDTAEHPIQLRIGISAGEPIAEGDDLYGTAVIAASRIGDRAGSGEIHASDVVRQLVAGKGFTFVDLGEVELRGLDEGHRLYEVRWRE